MATKSKVSEMADFYIAALAEWAEVTRKPLFGQSRCAETTWFSA
jgi:hypothetical protein